MFELGVKILELVFKIFPFFKKLFTDSNGDNSFDKIKTRDIQQTMIEFSQKQTTLEAEISDFERQIDELQERKNNLLAENSDENKDSIVACQRQIDVMKNRTKNKVDKLLCVLYNLTLLEDLKDNISMDISFKNNTKIYLKKYSKNQKKLAKYLNKSLKQNIKAKYIFTDSDKKFKEIKKSYEASNERVAQLTKTEQQDSKTEEASKK